jgi:hypothetical protein
MNKRMSGWVHVLTSREEGLSILLLILIAIIFLLYPLQRVGITNLLLVRLFFLLLVVAGVWTVSHSKKKFALAMVLAVLYIIFQGYLTVSPDKWVLFTTLTITIAFEALLTFFVLVRTVAPGPVNRYRIEGSVVVYLMIGLLFSTVYTLIYALNETAFTFSNKPESIELSQASLTYFSFITLTTIGYGDIQPLHPFSQAAAMMEGLIGQLFPAILIGRLVSQSLTSSSEKIMH